MRQNKGFTLIELLVVIAIFALIANVTMVNLNKAKRESRDAKRVDNVNQLRSALQLYHTENSAYPDDNGGAGLALGAGTNLILDDTGFVGSNPTSPIFMYSIPRDPSRVAAGAGSPCVWNGPNAVCDYGYYLDPDGNDYRLYFYLEGSVGDKAEGLHVATKDQIL